MAHIVSIDDYRKRRAAQANQLQAAVIKRHKDAEVVRRWQLRQSIETISRRMGLGTLYVQSVLRENFVAILPPLDAPVVLRRAA